MHVWVKGCYGWSRIWKHDRTFLLEFGMPFWRHEWTWVLDCCRLFKHIARTCNNFKNLRLTCFPILSAAEKRGLWEGVVQEPLRRALFCVFLCSEVIFSCKSHRNFFQKLPLQCRHFLENPLAKNPKTQLLILGRMTFSNVFGRLSVEISLAHGRLKF